MPTNLPENRMNICAPPPPLSVNNAAVKSDFDALTPSNDLTAYWVVFRSHAGIADALDYANLPQDVRDAIWAQCDAAETNGDVDVVADPAGLPAAPWNYIDQYPESYNGGLCDITRTEFKAIVAAKVAHSLKLEVDRALPWSLMEYSNEMLPGLFQPAQMTESAYPNNPPWAIDWSVGAGDWICSLVIVDHDVTASYALAQLHMDLAGPPRARINSLLIDMCETFRHSELGDPMWAVTPTWMFDTDPDRVARRGCHSTSQFARAMCQSVNIPFRPLGGYYYGQSHEGMWFPSIKRIVQHGDDVYEATYKGVEQTPDIRESYGLDYSVAESDYDDILVLDFANPAESQLLYERTKRLESILRMQWIIDYTQGWPALFQTYGKGWAYIEASISDAFDLPAEQWRLDKLYNDLVALTGSDGNPTLDTAERFPVLVEGGGKRHLLTVDNTPYFVMSEAAHSAAAMLNDADRDTYLDDVKSKGFTGLVVSIPEKHFTTHTPTYTDTEGNQLFNTTVGSFDADVEFWTGVFPPDYAEFNDYWKRVYDFLSACKDRNLYVLMHIAWSGAPGEGWLPELQDASNTDAIWQQYGQFVHTGISTVLDNVLPVLGGDVSVADMATGTPTTVESKLRALGVWPGSGSGVSMFQGAADQVTADYWTPASEVWLKTRAVVGGTDAYKHAETEWGQTPNAPIFLMRAGYENEATIDAYTIRRQHWLATLNGTLGGTVYGNANIWDFTAGWQAALDDPGRTQMIHLRRFMESRRWERFEPSFDATVLTSSRGTSGLDWKSVSYANDSSTIAVYTSDTATLNVDLSKIASTTGTVTAYWYDPSDGSSQQVFLLAPGTDHVQGFTHPGNNAAGDPDWVLVVDAASAGFGAPGL